jgi:hypothetical protein
MKIALIAAFLATSALANANCQTPQQSEFVLIEPGADTLAYVSSDYSYSNGEYRINNATFADEIFIDSFQPMEYFDGGWELRVVRIVAGHQTLIDLSHLECGLWKAPQLVVVNCNAVQP